MHIMAALGVVGAATAGVNADHDSDKFRLHISFGSVFPWRQCEPEPCRPVRCEPTCYREHTIWETVPRCEVWYDACGHRHERTVYVRVCRTVRVPVYACGHSHHDDQGYWRGDDLGGYRGHANGGWRGGGDDRPYRGSGNQYGGRGDGGRDYPQTWGLGDERRSDAESTKEIKLQDRVRATEPARAASRPIALPGKDARAITQGIVATPTKDASRGPQGKDGARSKGKAIEPAKLGGRLGQLKARKP
jgi:hypothetical protein